jgi:hypothetical protein
MPDDILKMKHHKLLFELKFLYADLQYHQTIMNGATSTFQEEFLKYIKEASLHDILFPEEVPEASAQDVETPDSQELFELDKKSVSTEVKHLYRKVVAITHPDKLVNLSDQEKEHRGSIFLKASAAAQQDNLFALQQIALDLGIELSPPTEKQLDIFEKEATSIRVQTGEMKKTYAWNWHTATDAEEKQRIMDAYTALMMTRVVKKKLDT